MLTDHRLAAKGKYLSWLLRHASREQGLPADEAGWVGVATLLKFADISREELDSITIHDPKQRFQCIGERIRACQGHSLDSGVTRDALETSWSEYQGDGSIWHGTASAVLEQISREGLLPGERTHVHCGADKDASVGKRAGVAVLLEISTALVRSAGQRIFVAPNGVVLVRHIPREAIVGLVPMTRAARKQEAAMRAVLQLPGTDGNRGALAVPPAVLPLRSV